jgi:CRISPR-associated protein Csd1
VSWLYNLYRTYEINAAQVGVLEKKANDQEFTLLPVSHTTQTAHIEVRVTEDGEFHSADVVDKQDATTVIPCTEDAASRSGKLIAPYPLHDKLSYVAGDYAAFTGETDEHFRKYIEQLDAWASSPHAVDKVRSIYAYLRKGRLIRDLIDAGILFVDENNRLIDKWDKQYEALYGVKPKLFSVLSGEQASAFVRFTVHSPRARMLEVWKDPDVYESFIRYYEEKLGEPDLCYVTGNRLPRTEKHANKIRNPADKAKLISANDDTGFTYRGRFATSREAAGISYDVSQKAHNALKWLINRQGKIIDNRVFLVWSNEAAELPEPTEDTFDLLGFGRTDERRYAFTNRELAREVAKALAGYRGDLESKSEVNIMILDSATTGRMAVLYYRNMDKQLYLDRLARWHVSCAWLHQYRKDDTGKPVSFYGAPSCRDISFAAYGPKADEKIVKGLMERMLPCIVDERQVPKDIVRSAFYRAGNPAAMEKWEWEKTLSIACALINQEEGLTVALDTENRDRDYLFGRLLAVADVLERRALDKSDDRATNAIRYMNAFSRHPARTWKIIQESLQPYQARLGAKGLYLSRLIDEIASCIAVDDFNNKPLSGKYLLGFYSQRHELYQKRESEHSSTNENENREELDQ